MEHPKIPEGVTLSPERQLLLDVAMHLRLHPESWYQGSYSEGYHLFARDDVQTAPRQCTVGHMFRIVGCTEYFCHRNQSGHLILLADNLFTQVHGGHGISRINDLPTMTASLMADKLTEAALHGL